MTFHFRTFAVTECEFMSAVRRAIVEKCTSLKYFFVEWLCRLKN